MSSSELRKGNRANNPVRQWFDAVPDEELFISVLVIGEIRQGIENIRRRDPISANSLDQWLADLTHHYSERILPVDTKVAKTWGCLTARQTLLVIDGLMAATALVYDYTLVTRNVRDIEQTGVRWAQSVCRLENKNCEAMKRPKY